MDAVELLSFIQEKKGYTIEGIDKVACPGLLLTILESMRQIAIAGPYSETEYRGYCNGMVGGEYGCKAFYVITGSLAERKLKVAPSTSECVSEESL